MKKILLPLFLVLFVVSCSTARKQGDTAATGEEGADVAGLGQGDVNEESLPATGLERVYFEFDRYTLSTQAREALRRNADYLKENPTLAVQVEGHCDSRGSEQYNLALGEKRARVVRTYLADLGVDPSRLEILSYGELKPLDQREAEEAWSTNRRAEFIAVKTGESTRRQ